MTRFPTVLVLLSVMVYGHGCNRCGPAQTVQVEQTWKNGIGMHLVRLNRGYSVCRHETSQAEFARVMGYNPSMHRGGELPVEFVTVREAIEFCSRLTQSEHKASRLPRDMAYGLPSYEQWTEYLAGADLENTELLSGSTYPVLDDVPNRLGLYWLIGNVSEYSRDLYYGGPEHLNLGPSFNDRIEDLKDPLTRKGFADISDRSFDTGFRVVCYRPDSSKGWSTGDTVMHQLAARGDPNALLERLKQDKDVNARNRWGDTPLHRAALWGHASVVSALLRNGAEIKAGSDGRTPLHWAAVRESGSASLLIEAGAKVNALDIHGWTPLMMAAKRGNRVVVQDLLEAGANPKVEAEHGLDAAYLADKHGHTDVSKVLNERNGEDK